MLAEAMKFLVDQRGDPSRRIVKAPAEPPHIYYVEQADGSLTREEAHMPPTNAKAADLDTLVAALIDDGGGAEIWYTRSAVVGVYAAGERDRITLPLSPSPQLATLIAWDQNKRVHLSQAEMILALRTVFADCIPEHPQLIDTIRRVKTSKAAEVDSQIQSGKVSLSRQDVKEMSGLSALPEQIVFTVRVFNAATIPVTARLRVCLEPDPAKEQFTLIPIPGEIEWAWGTGEAWLAARLAELVKKNAIPIYHGEP